MATFEEVCDRVAGNLPKEWEIDIELQFESGGVYLFDPSGESVYFPSNNETIEQTVLDALEHAIEIAKTWPSAPDA